MLGTRPAAQRGPAMSLNKTMQVNRCGSQDAISLIDTNITGLTEQLGSGDAVVSKIKKISDKADQSKSFFLICDTNFSYLRNKNDK